MSGSPLILPLFGLDLWRPLPLSLSQELNDEARSRGRQRRTLEAHGRLLPEANPLQLNTDGGWRPAAGDSLAACSNIDPQPCPKTFGGLEGEGGGGVRWVGRSAARGPRGGGGGVGGYPNIHTSK